MTFKKLLEHWKVYLYVRITVLNFKGDVEVFFNLLKFIYV